jgi:hypothetical protein
MDVLINLANILYVVAYFTTNIMRLRMLTLVAATCLAVYFYSQPVPLLNVVAWNLAFIALNLLQLVRLLAARHGISVQSLQQKWRERLAAPKSEAL